MIKIHEYKEPQHNLATEKFLSPEKLILPLSQHTGKASKVQVEIGQIVEEAEVIAIEDGYISARLHSPNKGKILQLIDTAHPVLGKTKAILIECIAERKVYQKNSSIDFSKQQLLSLIKEAGIVGMGGAAFPTHVKLNPPKKIDILIINGCECEPYLSSDYRLMIENTAEILEGVKLIEKILEPKEIFIAVEDNKPLAIDAINKLLNAKPTEFKNFKLKVLKTRYPQGGEKQLIYAVTKRKVPSGKLPFDVGCLVQNVATCFAIYEAIFYNKPLIERLVTFAGDALESPKNLWVKIGTTLKELFDREVLKFVKEPKKIICGGPMMGIALDSLEYPILKATGGFLFLTKDVKIVEEKPCIRCGACVRSCPMRLMPCLINLYSINNKFEEAKKFGAVDCIECGVCSFVCPANRFLVQSIKVAKLKLLK